MWVQLITMAVNFCFYVNGIKVQGTLTAMLLLLLLLFGTIKEKRETEIKEIKRGRGAPKTKRDIQSIINIQTYPSLKTLPHPTLLLLHQLDYMHLPLPPLNLRH